MSELETSVAVNLTGNLQRQAAKYNRALGSFSNNGTRHLSRLNRTVNTMSAGLTRLGNRYTALASGAVGVAAIRSTASLEERFERLGVQANKSTEEMAKLRQEIFDTARADNIKVDPSLITSAIEEIVEKTGDLKFARDNIATIGTVIQATGDKTGTAVGGILAEFQKMGIVLEKDVLEAIDILNVQGKEGAFTLAELAALGPRVVTSYTAMGAKGVPALRQMGAVLQVIRQGTGSSQQAATSFEALMRVLGDAEKLKVLQAGGINVFDPEKMKQGVKEIRPINEIMKELIERTRGDRTIIQQVLGDSESVRAFNAAVAEFGRTGGVASLDKFFNVTADGSTTLADSARLAKTASANWDQLAATWTKLSSETLDPLIKKVGELNNALGIGGQEAALGGAVATGAGAIVAGKVLKTRGSRKAAAAAAQATATNAPAATRSINAALGVQAASSGTGLLRTATRASGVAGLALAAFDMSRWTYDNLIKGRAIEYQAIEDWNKFIKLFGESVEKMDRTVERMEHAKPKVEIEVKGDPVKKVKSDPNSLEAEVISGVPLS